MSRWLTTCPHCGNTHDMWRSGDWYCSNDCYRRHYEANGWPLETFPEETP